MTKWPDMTDGQRALYERVVLGAIRDVMAERVVTPDEMPALVVAAERAAAKHLAIQLPTEGDRRWH